MQPKTINKATDSGLTKVINDGLTIKITVPTETLIAVAVTIIITTLALLLTSIVIKTKLTQ